MNLYGPDILSAKFVPWALRDFIIDHGGAERVRKHIWNEYFNKEYTRQLTQGVFGPAAIAKAHELCNKMVWEKTYQNGYVENAGKTLQIGLSKYVLV